MLTGRESLIRLVGKRRRLLPNRPSLLSVAAAKGYLNPSKGKNDGSVTIGAEGSPEKCLGGCGDDTCLARGTKRKLRQCTLLQLNFCSQSKVDTHFCESDQVGVNVVQTGCVDILSDTVHKLHGFIGAEESDTKKCTTLLNSASVLSNDVSAENLTNGDGISYRVDSSSMLPENKMPKYEMAETVDDICGALLKTFIVGRKFSDEVKLNCGARITLLRDPNNVKDYNAIKVVHTEAGCCKVIGFLPRDLAQYLSPLMDKYCFSFEGCVTSIPKHSYDVIPIQIMCQNEIFSGDKEFDDPQVKSLWENAICVSEFANAHPPSMSKYQQNFSLLIQEVLRSYSYLLSYNEKIALGTDFATGYIRSLGSISDLQDNDLKEVLYLLTVSELREILCKLKKRLFFLNGEQDLSAFLLVDLGIVKYPNYNCTISNQIFSDRNDLLAYEEAIEVAQIMDQSLDENNTEFVLRCIGISESRICNSSHREIHSSTSESQITYMSCFSASWVYSKVVLLGVSFLEREKRYNDAIDLLKQLLINFTSDGRRGYWTLRLSVDLEHVGCLNESLSVAEDGLLDPWVRAGSRTALQRRVLRLGKPPRRWKIPSFSESVKRKIIEVHVQGRPLNCRTGTKNRFYGEDGEQCGVEELALQYYAGEGGGWLGVHSESGIWLTIFGLLLWDALFADVPDVFRTRFQTAPLDLETDGFYETRKSIIEPLLGKIYEGMAEEILITSWESHLGTACRGVNWDRHSLSELRAAVTCIGGPCLASFCRHLAQGYRSWSSGMPDLLLWRFHGDYRGEAKLVEVKGPTDRLSEQQRAWLLVLMDCGFNAEVCKVSPAPISG
ncbi:zinc ion binding/nucleic acid binding/hydrolase [Actinidia rufa]|uniref:Fanconi-associated nuclease n=1 Tax=Actinidia rufa TaxID=165716 RepID=A0A7J0DB26_9ERIC|nr:zinc ion binding/nucleic acid binding/hydrolase [Actinidia rufa]